MLHFEEEIVEPEASERRHSPLHFERENGNDRGDKPKRSKLCFTPAEVAAEAGEPLPDAPTEGVGVPNDKLGTPKEPFKQSTSKAKRPKSQEIKTRAVSKSYNQIKDDASKEISKLADESENDAVRGADRYRRVGRKGAQWGKRYGKYRKGTAAKRLDKRQAKQSSKELLRELKEERYELLHGREKPSAVRRQKWKQKRKQIQELAERKLGKGTVEVGAKAIRLVVSAAKQIVGAIALAVGFPVLGVVGIFLLLGVVAVLIFSLITNTAVVALSSYTAEELAIEAASVRATRLETQLEKEIAGLPSAWKWGHIDEFRYDLDPIGHNPFELMAYLSVKYPGFDMGLLSPVPRELEELHKARYDLIQEEQVETRYRTEPSTDPVTGKKTEQKIPYDYYILNVILRSRSIEAAVTEELKRSPEGALWEWYKVLMETGGARQELANPFDVDWRSSVTSLYGYRLDPQNGQNTQLHRGLDIQMPMGTPIKAGLTGRVRYVGFDTSFGNYIILEDDKGATVQYSHCQSVLLATGDPVEKGSTVIAAVGSTGASTGSHLHIEIKQGGQYLNPIYALEFGGNE